MAQQEDDPRDVARPGAPIETSFDQVTFSSAVGLNIAQLLGSGIYSVPGSILTSVGSVGLSLIFWLLAPIFAYAGLAVYTELASFYPNRSGAEVVYLEQAWPKPRFLVPVSFAATTVLLSFSATNAIVFAQYGHVVCKQEITPYSQGVVALGVTTLTIGVVAISTKWALRIVDLLSILKVASLAFIVATGGAVLAGFAPRVPHPWENSESPFEGTTSNLNSLATAMVKVNFAFVGWSNAFSVLGEVKGKDPVRTVSRAGYVSLITVTVLFFFSNLAYIAAVPREEIRQSGQLIAALFFKRVFGDTWLAQLLPVMVALSCLGNLIGVTLGHTRILREVARQGLLPFSVFFSSTWPWGTPLGPVALKYGLTWFVILLVPAKDAFNFLLDVASYPHLVFTAATAIGVWKIRRRREDGLERSPYQASNVWVNLYLGASVFLLVMPWVPPENGHADVSFWYATYCVTGLGILAACGMYYYIWIILLPKLGNYEIVEEIQELDGGNGARSKRLVRRYHKTETTPLLGS